MFSRDFCRSNVELCRIPVVNFVLMNSHLLELILFSVENKSKCFGKGLNHLQSSGSPSDSSRMTFAPHLFRMQPSVSVYLYLPLFRHSPTTPHPPKLADTRSVTHGHSSLFLKIYERNTTGPVVIPERCLSKMGVDFQRYLHYIFMLILCGKQLHLYSA